MDYGHRLKTENMEPYFDRKKRLMPRPSDLSFYNWETQMSTSNPTPNFQVRPPHTTQPHPVAVGLARLPATSR